METAETYNKLKWDFQLRNRSVTCLFSIFHQDKLILQNKCHTFNLNLFASSFKNAQVVGYLKKMRNSSNYCFYLKTIIFVECYNLSPGNKYMLSFFFKSMLNVIFFLYLHLSRSNVRKKLFFFSPHISYTFLEMTWEITRIGTTMTSIFSFHVRCSSRRRKF